MTVCETFFSSFGLNNRLIMDEYCNLLSILYNTWRTRLIIYLFYSCHAWVIRDSFFFIFIIHYFQRLYCSTIKFKLLNYNLYNKKYPSLHYNKYGSCNYQMYIYGILYHLILNTNQILKIIVSRYWFLLFWTIQSIGYI
jgi:hypothetical protein